MFSNGFSKKISSVWLLIVVVANAPAHNCIQGKESQSLNKRGSLCSAKKRSNVLKSWFVCQILINIGLLMISGLEMRFVAFATDLTD